MSDFETAARPYSKAIFELATEAGSAPEDSLQFWSEVLQVISQITADEQMQQLISSPSVLNSQISEMIISILSSIKDAPEINQQVKNLVMLLAENDRLLAVDAIHTGYETLKQAAQGSIEVKVTSARKLTVSQTKTIASQLKTRLGKEVNILAEIDQSLIAGAIIQAGDLVIDGSALGRLGKLTTLLNK